jgi:hypothetical protein
MNTGPYVKAKFISNALQRIDQFQNIRAKNTTENNGHNLECRGMAESTILVMYQHPIEQKHKRSPPPSPTTQSTTDAPNQEYVNSITLI